MSIRSLNLQPVKTSQTVVCVEANSITFCIPKGKENVNIAF